ncbi:MAG: amidohydrolase family protein [Gemmatimonadetes bacterium]|nr:amidohydrolase family protein [Gemmatimonadota bacterium]MBL0177654.1 amidohydrolase family protein [Gemmatimonadota bacterium]
MRLSRRFALAALTLAAAPLFAQEPVKPAGQAEIRPGQFRAPEFPAPSILDYLPRNTLVVPTHMVPRAKYPVVDLHGHPPTLVLPEVINGVVRSLDSLNVRVMINASGSSGTRLTQQIAGVKAAGQAERFGFFTALNLRDVGPGSGAIIAAQLEADVKAGAVGLGEIGKQFGVSTRKRDGTRLQIDDPELDPVWEMAAKLKIPVFIHVADPAEFWSPLDFHNERWLELALFPDRRYQDRSRFPDFETLMGERDRLFARHPKTTFVIAHLGWHAQDLARLGKLFDRFPNLHSEIGAVLYDLGRQPRAAHAFFVKYQDRILFGKDAFYPEEYPYYWRVLETEDEYFDYYRGYHAFWKMYGMGLPDTVLQKLYFRNALRIIPGMPHTGFPK